MVDVTPGPFPENDGDRMVPERTLPAFVSGTVISNLDRDSLGDVAAAAIVFSSTEAPETNSRTRSTLWFRRGEGRMYKWDIIPFGATEGRWVSVSDRKDVLMQYGGTVLTGDILWRDTTSSLTNNGVQGRFGRYISRVSSFANGSEFLDRGFFVPPFFVAQTNGAINSYHVVTDRGFVEASVSGATGPAAGVLVKGDVVSNKLHVNANPTRPIDQGTLTYLAYITQSEGTVNNNTLTVFFTNLGSNLVL